MNVDLHTHTLPASPCSSIEHDDYLAWCLANDVAAIALTNHGDIGDNLSLAAPLTAEGILLIDGVEISTPLGDFVIFSPDLEYLRTLSADQPTPRAGDVPRDAAVVWVHPGAGGGRSHAPYLEGSEYLLSGVVDAVEVFNGRWLDRPYISLAERLAADLGAARTGGSDAHRVDDIMTCYTELPDSIASTADVVAALRHGETTPRRSARVGRRRRFRFF